MITEREHTSVHEAGHAVIGRKLGMSCGGATIVADEDSSGHHVVADPFRILWDWEARGKFREISSVFRGRIMTFMAGAEAERLVFGQTTGGEGDDELQCEKMAAEILDPYASETEIEAYLARLRSRTAHLVDRHKSDIRRVAVALRTQGTLSADEIEAILLQKGRLKRSDLSLDLEPN